MFHVESRCQHMHQKYVRRDVDLTFCQGLLSSLLTGNLHRFPNSHTFRPSENPVFGKYFDWRDLLCIRRASKMSLNVGIQTTSDSSNTRPLSCDFSHEIPVKQVPV